MTKTLTAEEYIGRNTTDLGRDFDLTPDNADDEAIQEASADAMEAARSLGLVVIGGEKALAQALRDLVNAARDPD